MTRSGSGSEHPPADSGGSRDPVDRLQTGFGHPDESPGLALWRVTNAWQSKVRAALKPYDLTHMQFVLLASLAWLGSGRADDGQVGNGDVVTQRDLAEHVGADPMMTSQVLRALELKHLVERRAHPNDSRARSLRATADGVALANRANAAVESADRAFFGALGGDQARLTSMLGRLSGR